MPSQTKTPVCLSYQGIYPCPVCRLGQITSLPLMEAMACSFCQHIFTINSEKQQLQLPSRQPPLLWRWNGRKWTGVYPEGMEWSWAYWLAAGALVIMPTALLGLTVYAFPPIPDTPLSWLPIAWVILAFLFHLAIVGWLVTEFYQFPLRMYLRAMWQHLLR